MLEKIVSGGQTGADRAALDIALELGLATGGWIPRGRRAEDGPIPDRYDGLTETDSQRYAGRTERNVRDSDATLILSFGPPVSGSALTAECAHRLGKPLLVLDLALCTEDAAVDRTRTWLGETRPHTLNVAGPRASDEPRIAGATARILRRALGPPVE